MGTQAFITDPKAFVVDHVTNHPWGEIFRLGHADFGNNANFVDVPWRETRSVGIYYREQGNGVASFPHHFGSTLNTELLQGDARGRAMPTIRRKVINVIPHDLVDTFHDAVTALLRRGVYHRRPHDSHFMVELLLTWVEVIVAPDDTHRIAVVGKKIRVGSRDVNALVWRTGETEWKLEYITPHN